MNSNYQSKQSPKFFLGSEQGRILRNLQIAPRTIQEFLHHLESFCHSQAHLSFSTASLTVEMPLTKKGQRVVYGKNRSEKRRLLNFIAEQAPEGIGVMMRSYTAWQDAVSGLPVQEIRGFYAINQAHKLNYVQLSPQETQVCFWGTHQQAQLR